MKESSNMLLHLKYVFQFKNFTRKFEIHWIFNRYKKLNHILKISLKKSHQEQMYETHKMHKIHKRTFFFLFFSKPYTTPLLLAEQK